MMLLDTQRFILSHPLNAVSLRSKAGAVGGYVGWQLRSRLLGARQVVPFVNDSKLQIIRGRPSSTGNLYTRLSEFAEMGFVLHALCPGETFVDVGANIGAFSILAASLGNMECIAFEPPSETFPLLLENIEPAQAPGATYNRTYIRDRAEMQQRLASAPTFKLSGGWTI